MHVHWVHAGLESSGLDALTGASEDPWATFGPKTSFLHKGLNVKSSISDDPPKP